MGEFEKINFYFEEGKRLWAMDPERVTGREFFELWESVQQPEPFFIKTSVLKLFDFSLKLKDKSSSKIGYFRWDDNEMAPALIVEGKSYVQKFLLFFNGGEPLIEEAGTVQLDDQDITHGERLDIIYDVIASYKKLFPKKDIMDITIGEYKKVLQDISAHHDAANIRAMKQLKKKFLLSLIKKALEDIPHDEISDQLLLPIDGTFASVDDDGESGNLLTASPRDNNISSEIVKFPVFQRTHWTILRELKFLDIACRFTVEAEKAFVLLLKDAQILADIKDSKADILKDDALEYKVFPVRIPAKPDMPIREGDMLTVYERGEENYEAGVLTVDLFDGNFIYGRISQDCISEDGKINERYYAKPLNPPTALIAAGIQELLTEIRDSYQIKGVIRNVIGMDSSDFSYRSKVDIGEPPETFDVSQKKAWTASVNPDNPVTLVQGPPGTGKTFVLEKVVRTLCEQGYRILITAPSNTAVDNICRRLFDFPLLRIGNIKYAIAPEVFDKCWIGNTQNVRKFIAKRKKMNSGGIYAGTHVGILKSPFITEDIKENGLYDVIVFDEAGMSKVTEFLLCAKLAHKAVLFGDHQQLPPFPLSQEILDRLYKECQPVTQEMKTIVTKSSLEWLVSERNFHVIMLQCSYRCQNPRLIRFSSIMFYDAGVKASKTCEYFRLSYHERRQKYPSSTLMLYSTSRLPEKIRSEQLKLEGYKPGFENITECRICEYVFYRLIKKYPLDEITIISPYKRQVRLIRHSLSMEKVNEIIRNRRITLKEWKNFLYTRIATVDSFQGAESDVVIISYVRSNKNQGIGFVDDPNRINVAHTRCRREMIIIGDMECLKAQDKNFVFARMERTIERDGTIIRLTEKDLPSLGIDVP